MWWLIFTFLTPLFTEYTTQVNSQPQILKKKKKTDKRLHECICYIEFSKKDDVSWGPAVNRWEYKNLGIHAFRRKCTVYAYAKPVFQTASTSGRIFRLVPVFMLDELQVYYTIFIKGRLAIKKKKRLNDCNERKN